MTDEQYAAIYRAYQLHIGHESAFRREMDAKAAEFERATLEFQRLLQPYWDSHTS